MASGTKKNRSGEDEDTPEGPGAWIVTFSDCMTLLLCFFVMLLTFSSFDEVARKRFAGAFESEMRESLSRLQQSIPESMVEQVERRVDHTEKGSEMPTDLQGKNTPRPKKMDEILETDAHRDRRVFFLPAEQVFWGNGLVMKEQGKRHLDMIAGFLAMMPCFVIINDSRADEPGRTGLGAPSPSLARAWEMVKYCKDKHGIPTRYFSIAADGGVVARARFGGRPVIELALVAPRVYR